MECLQSREESISKQDRQIGGQKNVNCLRKREELNNSFYLHIRVFWNRKRLRLAQIWPLWWLNSHIWTRNAYLSGKNLLRVVLANKFVNMTKHRAEKNSCMNSDVFRLTSNTAIRLQQTSPHKDCVFQHNGSHFAVTWSGRIVCYCKVECFKILLCSVYFVSSAKPTIK